MSEEEFEYGDYDLEEEVDIVPASEALPYPDVEVQDDDHTEDPAAPVRSFVNVFGRSPADAIAIARAWCKMRRYVGIGQCLRTVRQYYNVPSKYGTAAQSWLNADHKHFSNDGRDAPRGAPVWWTGGSRGAGHVAISVGGGVCLSTDWKESGRIDYAHINDITSHWALDYKGWTREVNDVVVWRPSTFIGTVHLNWLKPGNRNADVLKLKKRLHEKGYRGFLRFSNKYGIGLKRAYAKYQRHLGYSGSDANGVPGRTSLKRLGFKVL